MKALSMRPAQALKFVFGLEDEDSRCYDTPYRGSILIGSTKSNAVNGTIPGCIIGIADLVGTLAQNDKEYTWIFENIRPVKPVEYKGKQRVFDIDLEEKDLVICDFNQIEEISKWLDENFMPYLKGAEKDEDGKWMTTFPFELPID